MQTQTTTTETPASVVNQGIPDSQIDQPVSSDESDLILGMLADDDQPAPVVEAQPTAVTSPEATPPVTPPVVPGEVVAPASQPADAQQTQPAVTPPVDPAAAQQAPVAEQSVVAPPAAVPPQDATSVNSFDALRQKVEENREMFTQALTESVYKLSDTEKDELAVDPGTMVPKLMAKAHLNMVQNVLGVIAQQMPVMVNSIIQANAQHAELENAFFSKWPQLDKDKDRQTVMSLAAAFRKAEPNADFNRMVQMVGAQAVVALGKLQPAAPAVHPQAAPQVVNGFVPAANGTPAPSPAPKNDNPFAVWNDMILQEEG